MAIWMTGIDHNRAGLDVRSVFSFTRKKLAEAYPFFLAQNSVKGCVILATCNRTQLWFSVGEGADFCPEDVLCSFFRVDKGEYDRYLMNCEGWEAIDSLFRIAAGLESRIMGEDQIITQVGDALVTARSMKASDNILEVLFRTAVTAGKRVKTSVSLSTADKSVIHVALRELKERGTEISGRRAMVIGNGMMGRLSAQALLDEGADVTVTVRQYKSGIVDIPRGCRKINYDDRYKLFDECDIVVSATSSPHYTLEAEKLRKIKLYRQVLVIDLAVPRDIEPAIAGLENVEVHDIDDFHIDLKSDRVLENIRKAEKILREEETEFDNWYSCRDLVPRFAQIKEKCGEDVAARMSLFFKTEKLDKSLEKRIRREVESAVERMMNNLLFSMKDRLGDSDLRSYIDNIENIMDV